MPTMLACSPWEKSWYQIELTLVQLDREQLKRLDQKDLVELNLVLQRQLEPGNERTDL